MDSNNSNSNSLGEKYKEAATWALSGMLCFLFQAVFLTITLIINYPAMIDLYGQKIVMVGLTSPWSITILISLFLALFTKLMLLDPLEHMQYTKQLRLWAITLGIFSIFFGMIVGIIVLFYADEKMKPLKSNSVPTSESSLILKKVHGGGGGDSFSTNTAVPVALISTID